VGPLGKGAGDWGDSDVNADRDGIGVCWGEQVNRHVKGATSGVVREALGGFTLNVVFSAGEASKRCKELKKGEEGITDMVVEGGFIAFREAAGEEVITVTVARLVKERAKWGCGGVENREAKFTAKEKTVDVRGKTMVSEASG
jgi:hypothetical protein